MSLPAEHPQPSTRPPEPPAVPGWFSTFRGIWSFTWKARLGWRRFPLLILGLFIFPALAYLSIREVPPDYPVKSDSFSSGKAVVEVLSNELRLELRDPAKAKAFQNLVFSEYEAVKFPTQDMELSAQRAMLLEELNAFKLRVLAGGALLFSVPQHWQLSRALTAFESEVKNHVQRSARRPFRPFFHWFFHFYTLILVPLYCLSVGGAMVRDDLQSDTLGFLITRPVSRSRLFAVKFLAQLLWLQLLLGVHTLLLCAVGVMKNVPSILEWIPLILGVQVLAVFAWSSLSSLLGLLTRRYLVLGISYGFVVELGIGQIPTNINSLSISRHLKMLYSNHPLVELISNWGVDGAYLFGTWEPHPTLFAIGALAGFTLLFFAVACFVFTWREYNYSDEMQK